MSCKYQYIKNLKHIIGKVKLSLWIKLLKLQSRLIPWPWKKNAQNIAINMYPALGAWGGSSVFVHQVISALRKSGFRTVFDLHGEVDAIIVIDPRDSLLNKAFGMDEVRAYRRFHPNVKIIHRINECDQRKDSTGMDEILREANDIADYTIFISEWLRDYFIQRWFNPEHPHSVVYNGADSNVFYPVRHISFDSHGTVRFVTHHWSPNPMKGFAVYKQLDDLIADGKIQGAELWIIGQWPKNTIWRSARTFPPTSGTVLADLLRQCHVYITASLWEPCGMHHVEGAQCGLPLLFHEDGGGIVEAGNKYGIGFREESLLQSIKEMRERYFEMREKVLKYMPDGKQMASECVQIVQKILSPRA